jgi:putative FmdB family regulatory protein
MPTYEFRCPLGHEFEIFYRSISRAEAQAACPVCGQLGERMMSAGAGLVFKGSGFYLTDYGKNAHREKGTVDAKAEGAKGEGSSTEAKSDSPKSEGSSSAGESSSSSGSSDGAKSEGKKAEAKAAESKPAAAPPKSSSGE